MLNKSDIRKAMVLASKLCQFTQVSDRNDIVWANYEAIQADIFDHILAVVPEFGLRVFQKPSGHDLGRISGLYGLS
jgi:hypothetical protein